MKNRVGDWLCSRIWGIARFMDRLSQWLFRFAQWLVNVALWVKFGDEAAIIRKGKED